MTKNIDRKEIALIVEEMTGTAVSVQQVKTNEKHWGLSEARVPDMNKRVIRYSREKVIQAIMRTLGGFLPS